MIAVNNNVKSGVTFWSGTGAVRTFAVSPTSTQPVQGDCKYCVLSISDGTLGQNYTTQYLNHTITTINYLGGTGIASPLPKVRPRIVTYKLLFLSNSEAPTSSTDYAALGKGVKRYVKDFVRGTLDRGGIRVQYGYWGGIDIDGYLVDEPQAEYNAAQTEATLTFTLQFITPITLHPNFVNSKLWSDDTAEVNWLTMQPGTWFDEKRLIKLTTVEETITLEGGTTKTKYTATATNVKYTSNIAVLLPKHTENKALIGNLKITADGNDICLRTIPFPFAPNNRMLYFLQNYSYYANVEVGEPVHTNLTKYTTNYDRQVGLSAAPPCSQLNIEYTTTYSTSGLKVPSFCLLGW